MIYEFKYELPLCLFKVFVPAGLQKGAGLYAKDRMVYLNEDEKAWLSKVIDVGILDTHEKKESMLHRGPEKNWSIQRSKSGLRGNISF